MSNKNQRNQQQQATQKPANTSQDTSQQENQQQEQGQENKDPAQTEQQQQPQDNAGGAGEGEQQSNGSNNEQSPAVEKKEAVVVKEPVQEKAIEVVATPVSKTQQEGFTPVYNVQLDLTNYAEHMDPKKSMVPEEGGKWQYGLFGTLKGVLNSKDQEEFNKAWNTALVFFHQNKDGMFNENFMFRFPEQWPGSATEFTSFRRIIYLMIATANAKTRKSELKHINMELVVEGLNQAQRSKLLNFYEA